MYLSYKTDVGNKRDENQDSIMAAFIDENISFAVLCDGMGGAQSGGVASDMAAKTIYNRIKDNFRPNAAPNSIRNLMLTAVHAANTLVYDKSREDIDKNGMGTTCVVALVQDKHCYVVSVGDSRAYMLTKGGIDQITTDHTYVQMLYEQGIITKEEQKTHKLKNVITRALGVEADVELDYFELEPEGDFSLLLCSDGMSNYCDEQFIYDTVYGKNLDKAVDELINYSNEQGGNDNITVAIIAN